MCIERNPYPSARFDVGKLFWNITFIVPIFTAQIEVFIYGSGHELFSKRAHERARERAHKRAHERANVDLMSQFIPKI